MSFFNLPEWLSPHLFTDKKFSDLTSDEMKDIRDRLAQFRDPNPEVSVVIPAWNEENNIYRTLSALAANRTSHKVEIIVVNNNSTDQTQRVLDELGVRNYLQPIQGTPHARQMGLENARGTYHLCADSDTFYPPDWIELMVEPMTKNDGTTGVYGTYSFLPPEGQGRFGLAVYEEFGNVISKLRKKNREYLNVFGFNMGFITEVGLTTGGFKVSGNRVYANVVGADYANEAEDGRMALNLKTKGRLVQVTNPKARVFTSSRRLMDDGSIGKAFWNRAKRQFGALKDYL
jgi:cellulose synthase/poly-beta-1,6-N-acetylglucosamine synthase-like glycosyltransferase